MAKWGRNFFHKFREKVKKYKELLNSLVNRTDEDGVREYFYERDKLNELLLHKEIYWKVETEGYSVQVGRRGYQFKIFSSLGLAW